MMPEGPRPDGPGYDDDFYAWTQYQAEVLRSMPSADNRFDRENVVEEIESLGKSQRDAVRSQVRRILEHFLKLTYSSAAAPRFDWMASIADARGALDDQLSPTLRHDIEDVLGKLYTGARRQAALGLRTYGELGAAEHLPVECPYTLDQIYQDDWYPEPPGEPQ
jgi:hypothetical protein